MHSAVYTMFTQVSSQSSSFKDTCPSSRNHEIPEIVTSRWTINSGEILHAIQADQYSIAHAQAEPEEHVSGWF